MTRPAVRRSTEGLAEGSRRTMASLEATRFIGRVSSPASGFRIEFVDDWKLAIARWSGAGQETAFQHPLWYESWYGAFAEASPLIAIVTDSVTERPVALV